LELLADLTLPRIPDQRDGVDSVTYVFVPQDFLQGLFAVFGMDLPTQFTNFNFSGQVIKDTIPSNIDPSKIAYLCEFLVGLFHIFYT